MSSTRPHTRRMRLSRLLAVPLLPLPLLLVPTAGAASPSGEERVVTDPEPVSVVRLAVPDQQAVEDLEAQGYDLAHYTKPISEGLEVHAVLTAEEQSALQAGGVQVLGILEDARTLATVQAERSAATAAAQATETATDTLTPLRTEWFTSVGGTTYLNLEVKSDAPASVTVTAAWEGGSVTLQRFVDRGQYMYHRASAPVPVGAVPETVTYSSSGGDEVSAPVTQWLGTPRKDPSPHYASGFVDRYMDPTEVTERVEGLAAEFPQLAEIIDLPYETNGYRRHAQVTVGTLASHAFYVTSTAWGHEGGNDTRLVISADGADQPLSVDVDGSQVTVHLATDSSGASVSTANDVVAALNAAAGDVMTAALYRGSAGTGVVTANGTFALTDNLNAPEHVSRDPFQMKAIRIGEQRDGSKPGVMLYCQEHAREWVTPLTCVETAERLLRNYQHDPGTRKLLKGLDVFIMPTVNPDGGHYSFYDYSMQRKNMTNHCGPEVSDPAARNNWGVDLNRNFTVGSGHDGYVGGSLSCSSGTYAGPAELSEPEAKNEVWLTEEFPNIDYAMNTHSYGGYFMWAPGSYDPERTTLPRPDFGTEEYFWEASEHILSTIQDHRGTAIWPGRTGPVIDVLYSAAGNSADEHWYEKGIFAWNFEVGADLWDADAGRWRAAGFQPTFEEGYEEAMEFSNGMIGMLEVALERADDRRAPTSSLSVTSTDPGSTSFVITTDEAAQVYYTTDGSRPTYDSPMVQSAGLREGPAEITVTSDATVRWFSVDMAGNVERNYNPDGKAQNFRSAKVRVG